MIISAETETDLRLCNYKENRGRKRNKSSFATKLMFSLKNFSSQIYDISGVSYMSTCHTYVNM